jgi:hypothetical protein
MAEQVVADLRERCATPASLLRDVAAEMADEMRAGLEKEGGSRVKMLLSYVDKLPTGFVLRTYTFSSSLPVYLSECLLRGKPEKFIHFNVFTVNIPLLCVLVLTS